MNPLDPSSIMNSFGRHPTPVVPATRQKSCNACVRGKRRCDKTTPRCTRCAAKSLDCVYQRLPPNSSPSSVTLAAHLDLYNYQSSSSSSSAAAAAPDFDYDTVAAAVTAAAATFNTATMDMPHLTGSSNSATDTSPESLDIDSTLDFSLVDILTDGDATSASNLWGLPGFADPKNPFSATIPMSPANDSSANTNDTMPSAVAAAATAPLGQAIRDVAVFNYETQNKMHCEETDPLLVYNPRTSIGYLVKYLTKLHLEFSQTRSASFIHNRLYTTALPGTVMAAFSAASAYATRTPDTRAWTYRLLADAAREVRDRGDAATSVLDMTARLQALLIIDTMRVFDGDYALRHASEKDIPLTFRWIKELADAKAELEVNSVTAEQGRNPRDRAPPSWENWILLESSRRTIITSLSFLCLLSILRSEMPDQRLWSDNSHFTASKHLWEASTAADFNRAWRDRPHWPIKDCSFKEFWMYARPDDIDEFTKLMLTSQIGPDAVDIFLQGETPAVSVK